MVPQVAVVRPRAMYACHRVQCEANFCPVGRRKHGRQHQLQRAILTRWTGIEEEDKGAAIGLRHVFLYAAMRMYQGVVITLDYGRMRRHHVRHIPRAFHAARES